MSLWLAAALQGPDAQLPRGVPLFALNPENRSKTTQCYGIKIYEAWDNLPVWFTRRPDANFYEYLSRWMDQRVDGALGGSVFQYFAMVVDYPRARAYFSTTGSFGLND